MTLAESYKGRVLWLLERYSLDNEEIDPLCFYGWLSYAREDLVDYKNAYQHIKGWLEDYKINKNGSPKAATG
jgi:hypothetical protein